ncbi:MAG: succinylglutamate desuccinylase/aspartoacylase family protein [Gammaproteobacteria bacterium]
MNSSRTLLLSLLALVQPAWAADPPSPAWGPLELLERTINPGEKRKFSFQEVPTFEGSFLNTAVFAARGNKPGPTLCLTALIHGDERNGFEVARTAFAQTDERQFAGTLIALPAINVNGFRTGSRYMPDRRDLNRAFPGDAKGSNTSLIAGIIFDTVKAHCDALIDLHTGSFDRANVPQVRVDLANPRALDLARRFGAAVVMGGAGPHGSLRREVMDAGIPAIIYEAGLPLRFEPVEIARGVQGVRNVMMGLGMVTGKPTDLTPESHVYASARWLRVPVGQGGVFYAEKPLGAVIVAGESIAHIDDPFTDQRYGIRAESAGTIVGMAVPQVVFSGYALIHVARN